MDTNKTRRRLFGLIGGSAAAIALAELRPAKATGSNSSTNSHTEPPQPPVCGQCPPGCTCSGGQCVPTTPAYNCVAEIYNLQVAECTHQQLAINCSKLRNPKRRQQCQARKRRGIATCRSAALQYSNTVCTPA